MMFLAGKGIKHPIVTIVIISFFYIGCAKNSSPAAAQTPEWKLVWQDEFDYTGLPDTAKWSYETGHIRNNEQQYYTDARKENIRVENGFLTITGRKERYQNAFYKAGSTNWKTKNATAEYTSASINTLGKADWKFGRIEIRAKLPQGGGVWPALWMLGSNIKTVDWPASGEIDIMEFIGDKAPTTIYGTIHHQNGVNTQKSSGSKITSNKLVDEFHTYSIEWDKDSIGIYFDSVKFHNFLIETAGTYKETFRRPFYLLINLALGGDWPGPVDAAVLPQEYIIDYVRVYQK